MRAKFIYEKFTDESDPIEDMGIGLGKAPLIRKIKQTGAKIIFNNDYVFLIDIPSVKAALELGTSEWSISNKGNLREAARYFDQYQLSSYNKCYFLIDLLKKEKYVITVYPNISDKKMLIYDKTDRQITLEALLKMYPELNEE